MTRSMVEIRRATADDSDAIAALRVTWVRETAERDKTGEDPDFANELRTWLEKESGQRLFWLAWRGPEAIGMVNLTVFDRMPTPGRPSGDWGYLGNMYVLAAERDEGIGTRLVEAVLAFADEVGLERVVLKPSRRSVSFYGRSGFHPATELMLRPLPG